jgi:hypothetical protein
MNRKLLDNIVTFLMLSTVLVCVGTEVVLNLTPPISRDALVHHLAIPKLWLKHGGFYEMPWADYSYYPMYINLLYLVCLYFKNDILPKFIHLAFGLGTGGLIYRYLKHKFDRNWGLLGMVIFITTPIVIWLSTSAYIDLGMTFFTTGSVLAFLKWRDSEYNRFRWFLISSCCMGIAIGSKYNALIAWFIINMFLMFSFSRDTHRQVAAVTYGILFFAISLCIASPWYVKNYFQTGNPFYPLFKSIFQSLQHGSLKDAVNNRLIEKTGSIGFFKMREIMYGESLVETLLIPIRMFFQGQDNSYQYFQGSLNPMLIVFLPFILLSKKYKPDKYFFVFFSVIFIFIAYFLTEKQVRYILPTIPFFPILAVMGIKDLADKLQEKTLYFSSRSAKNITSMVRIVIFTSVAVFLMFNLLYLKNRISIIKPFAYVLGQETEEAFLKRHLLHYDGVRYINANLPVDARIFTMFLGRRGYYLERAYRNEPSFGMNTINQMVNSSTHPEKFVEYIRSMDVTHILMRTELFDNYLKNNFSEKKIKRFMGLVKKHWKLLYEYNGYAVWALQPEPN